MAYYLLSWEFVTSTCARRVAPNFSAREAKIRETLFFQIFGAAQKLILLITFNFKTNHRLFHVISNFFVTLTFCLFKVQKSFLTVWQCKIKIFLSSKTTKSNCSKFDYKLILKKGLLNLRRVSNFEEFHSIFSEKIETRNSKFLSIDSSRKRILIIELDLQKRTRLVKDLWIIGKKFDCQGERGATFSFPEITR